MTLTLAVKIGRLEAEVITETERLKAIRLGDPDNQENNRRLIRMIAIRTNLERARLTAAECE